MDVFDILLQAGIITSAIVAYLLVFKKTVPQKGSYKKAAWNYPLKLLYARYAIHCWKRKLRPNVLNEEPNPDQREGWDAVCLRGTASDGAAVLLSIRKICGRKALAETAVFVKLPDGTTYVLPQPSGTAISAWEPIEGGWSANGLKIQILEPQLRMRIIYNGLLKRTHDNVTQHVKMNLIWVAATSPIRHPEDWSNKLAAEALAIEPWRESNWPDMIRKWKDGTSHQFGAAQGRFQSYDSEGVVDRSVYLQVRGVSERSWAPHGFQPVRRAVYLTAAARDGTVVQLRCMSYRNVLTECISGSVRQPNYVSEAITSTDIMMSEFCETPQAIINAYTINVSTKTRDLKLIIRINNDGGQLTSGVFNQQLLVYKTIVAEINGFPGSGILELGYEGPVVKDPPSVPERVLRMCESRGSVPAGACVALTARAATCTDLVGGKGASLALLASVQKDEGYKVPPGFCLTIKALEMYLELNPNIRKAIQEIAAANENYDENVFKQKCQTASSMFVETAITGELKDEILASMVNLRKEAADENLGNEPRFAVRSSAVGEDSEVLSAAGQNETILGCVSDEDILNGVQKCWASMFAFTSAYYRRQNGQPCECGGGVVVQALVGPRAAGVMFTRHPHAGDPATVLLTANYGLGESVVSGSVEPDTFIIHREFSTNDLSIASTIIGAKKQRVTVVGQGVGVTDVSAGEQTVACLGDEDVLRLARLGVNQDRLWGAGRDIEWAFVDKDIYLLQARPITSLERWSEEELLHELDDPIMSDDEIISFGNTGEVLPRPMTPLSYDAVIIPLRKGIDAIVGKHPQGFDHSIITTHNRCALSLYNSIYQRVPKKVDINIRMIEMAVHGHEVADDAIMSTALHRRAPQIWDKPTMILLLIKTLLSSKRAMNSSIKESTSISIGEHIDNLTELCDLVEGTEDSMKILAVNHSITSTASTSSQFIAMNVLLEGRSDFSPELCNEIGTLLSSGDVLSAEVPHSLARLARRLEDSGRYQEFRNISYKEAFEWLKVELPDIYKEVCEFLKTHGHRAIMEFDLSTKPWVLVPEEMMKVLQNLRASKEENQKSKTDDEIIASLVSPQKASTRKVLRWVMPLCRRTIRHREGTKAHIILGVHKLRLTLLRLAKLMVKEWYLPYQDLIFFFRFNELKNYIKTRDPSLLRKALQRHQYYPRWCKLKFAEINVGWLSPLARAGPRVTSGDVRIEAASVCGGDVVARACVVKDLSEIDQLQQGDVLITHATDIGWSPYFPLLTGIVTELGGLISHGAVIAREYGLPCIVGAANATDIFKTGDTVRLSGTKGTLERVQVTEQTEEKDASNHVS